MKAILFATLLLAQPVVAEATAPIGLDAREFIATLCAEELDIFEAPASSDQVLLWWAESQTPDDPYGPGGMSVELRAVYGMTFLDAYNLKTLRQSVLDEPIIQEHAIENARNSIAVLKCMIRQSNSLDLPAIRFLMMWDSCNSAELHTALDELFEANNLTVATFDEVSQEVLYRHPECSWIFQ